MKEPELSGKVQQKIDEFASIELIHPSAEWKNSLMQEIGSVHQFSPSKVSTGSVTVLLLFLLLLNVGFILTTLVNKNESKYNRSIDLKVISTELLVNPVSINL
jgi:hypothetical protein